MRGRAPDEAGRGRAGRSLRNRAPRRPLGCLPVRGSGWRDGRAQVAPTGRLPGGRASGCHGGPADWSATSPGSRGGRRSIARTPRGVDLLRQNARRLYELLAPYIKQHDPDGLLDTPIQNAAGAPSGPTRSSTRGCRCTRGFRKALLPGSGAQPPAARRPAARRGASLHHAHR